MTYALIENNQTLARYEEEADRYTNGAWFRESDGQWVETHPADILFDGRPISDEQAVEFCRKYNLDPQAVMTPTQGQKQPQPQPGKVPSG